MATIIIQEKYPDLFNEDAGSDSATNYEYKRLYTAVLYLLKQYYNFDSTTTAAWLTVDTSADTHQVTLQVLPENFGDASTVSTTDKIHVLAIYGRMIAENMSDPANGRDPADPKSSSDIFINDPVDPDSNLRIVTRFIEELTRGERLYNASRELYQKVYSRLLEVGQTPTLSTSVAGDGEPDAVSEIFARQLSEVVDRLVEDNVGPDTPQLRLFIDEAISQAAGGSISGRASAIKIDLPDLDEDNSVEILADNVRALAVLYFAAQLEDMRFFAVADKVAEQFGQGMLPVSRGSGGDNLFDFIKEAPNRFTEIDRRGMYARAFGFAQGGVDEALPNREFSNLWIRALSATSAFNRQYTYAPYTAGTNGSSQLINLSVQTDNTKVHHMQVYKTLRDLSVNLSLHGYGIAHFAAVELQTTIRTIKAMLSHSDLLSAFGVRDYNQLIERVARMYLGSEINSIRQRVQAQAGARIIEWMANNSSMLASPIPPRQEIFMDADLVDNVEKWLAVTGTGGTTITQYSEPIAVRSQPTIPSLSLGRATQQLQDITEMISDGLPAMEAN